jgi:hypothetical protein
MKGQSEAEEEKHFLNGTVLPIELQKRKLNKCSTTSYFSQKLYRFYFISNNKKQ